MVNFVKKKPKKKPSLYNYFPFKSYSITYDDNDNKTILTTR